MSILAVLLVIGAPALVSQLDKDKDVSREMLNAPLDDTSISVFRLGFNTDGTTNPNWIQDVSFVKGSSNNGVYTYALPANENVNTRCVKVAGFAVDDFREIDTISVTHSTGIPASVKLEAYGPPNSDIILLIRNFEHDALNNTWNLSLDSIQRARLNSADLDRVLISFYFDNGTVPVGSDFTIKTYTIWTVNIGELVMGILGAVLIGCAVMATPYFGIGNKRGA